jgi:CheY-like chemotaxis protein
MQNSGMENRQFPDSSFKVLVVDDHPNTANMLARAISRLGSHVEVIAATSGLKALQNVEDKVADILITDMMMPEMTGIELIETLNDTPSITPSVTFLLTAYDSASVREIAQRLNVRDVIAKPAHPEDICELISKTIGELEQSKLTATGSTYQKEPNTEPSIDTREEDIMVDQLLWEVAKKFQPQADVKDHLLVVGKTDPDSMVRGNPVQLRQALRSLVWVAIHNTPKGGTVILSSEDASNTVKIFVRDTGYGNSQINETDGIDHDLAVVNSIAKQHGGNVTVESEAGKGSCFTMSLPLATRAEI